jgi:hypothetical protein
LNDCAVAGSDYTIGFYTRNSSFQPVGARSASGLTDKDSPLTRRTFAPYFVLGAAYLF